MPETRIYAPAQVTYLAAKAAHLAIGAEKARLLGAIPQPAAGARDEEIDRYEDAIDAVERQIGYWMSASSLQRAENALIDWAEGVMRNESRRLRRPEDLEALDMLPRMRRSLGTREKVLDLCMRLELEERA